eukprot:gene9147-10799_t
MDQSNSVVNLIQGDIDRRRQLGESIADIAHSYDAVIPGLAVLMNLIPNSDSKEVSMASPATYRWSPHSTLPPPLPSLKPPKPALRGLCVPSNPASLPSSGYEQQQQERVAFMKTDVVAEEEAGKSTQTHFGYSSVKPSEHSTQATPITPSAEPITQSSNKRRKFENKAEASIVSPEPVVSTTPSLSRPPRQRIERVPFDPLADVSILKERDFSTPEHAQSRLDDIAFNSLRDEFGSGWRKVHGKGQHKDWHRYIYVNPMGKKYTLESGAVEGTDFFLTPQAALEYCREQVVQNLTA